MDAPPVSHGRRVASGAQREQAAAVRVKGRFGERGAAPMSTVDTGGGGGGGTTGEASAGALRPEVLSRRWGTG
jgi:hypothetical protein